MIKEQKKQVTEDRYLLFLFFGFSLSLFAEIGNCCNHGSNAGKAATHAHGFSHRHLAFHLGWNNYLATRLRLGSMPNLATLPFI